MMLMTDAEFRECISSRPGAAAQAARAVLVDGKTPKAAAALYGVGVGSVHNECSRVRANHGRLSHVFGNAGLARYLETLKARKDDIERTVSAGCAITSARARAAGILGQFINEIEGLIKCSISAENKE